MPRSEQQLTVVRPRRTLPAMTTKFEQAIQIYAMSKAVRLGGVNGPALVNAAVSAYRMGYEDLYHWMRENRFRWDSRIQRWKDLREEG